jgi:hypothetical protein
MDNNNAAKRNAESGGKNEIKKVKLVGVDKIDKKIDTLMAVVDDKLRSTLREIIKINQQRRSDCKSKSNEMVFRAVEVDFHFAVNENGISFGCTTETRDFFSRKEPEFLLGDCAACDGKSYNWTIDSTRLPHQTCIQQPQATSCKKCSGKGKVKIVNMLYFMAYEDEADYLESEKLKKEGSNKFLLGKNGCPRDVWVNSGESFAIYLMKICDAMGVEYQSKYEGSECREIVIQAEALSINKDLSLEDVQFIEGIFFPGHTCKVFLPGTTVPLRGMNGCITKQSRGGFKISWQKLN